MRNGICFSLDPMQNLNPPSIGELKNACARVLSEHSPFKAVLQYCREWPEFEQCVPLSNGHFEILPFVKNRCELDVSKPSRRYDPLNP
jgi:hypothetical protein